MEVVQDEEIDLYRDTRLPINFSCGCTIIVKDVNSINRTDNNFQIHSFILCKKHKEIMIEELSEYAVDPEIFLGLISEQLSDELEHALERKLKKIGIDVMELFK